MVALWFVWLALAYSLALTAVWLLFLSILSSPVLAFLSWRRAKQMERNPTLHAIIAAALSWFYLAPGILFVQSLRKTPQDRPNDASIVYKGPGALLYTAMHAIWFLGPVSMSLIVALLASGLPWVSDVGILPYACLLYTSPSPRDATLSRMPSSA